ncbi:MAG: STAS domain-containing protein [Ignavibacteria bacterium]|nr:STAS domain-containing protein [Ignavibacteria bacterium]
MDTRRTARYALEPGHLGLGDSMSLSELVKRDIEDGVNEFEFDFSGLSSLNSAGIGILIGCRKAILANEGVLRLSNVNDKIKEIFRLTKIDGLFVID